MSTKKKSHYHRGPDKEGEFSKVLHTIEAHLKSIFIGLFVVIVLVFVVFLTIHLRGEKEEKAHMEFQTLHEEFLRNERDVYNWRQSDEKRALLEEYKEKFQGVYEEFPQTTFGRESLFKAGKLQAVSGQHEEALSSFKEYYRKAANDLEKARGMKGMAKTYESIAFETGENDKYLLAIEQYERTINRYSDLIPFYLNALLNAGNCYIYIGELDKAEELLQTLLAEKTDANQGLAFFDEARERLEEIERRKAMR